MFADQGCPANIIELFRAKDRRHWSIEPAWTKQSLEHLLAHDCVAALSPVDDHPPKFHITRIGRSALELKKV
jgi:hypothetical protein